MKKLLSKYKEAQIIMDEDFKKGEQTKSFLNGYLVSVIAFIPLYFVIVNLIYSFIYRIYLLLEIGLLLMVLNVLVATLININTLKNYNENPKSNYKFVLFMDAILILFIILGNVLIFVLVPRFM